MLPEVGASELIVLAAVALIVVGPKDLPMLLRRIGQMVRKVRLLAADFRASFDDMARQTELDDLRREVDALRQTRLTDTIGPVPTFEELNQGLQPTDVVRYDESGVAVEATPAETAPSEAAPAQPAAAPSILPPATEDAVAATPAEPRT
jgi:sec-independent protein translocase protein TatB